MRQIDDYEVWDGMPSAITSTRINGGSWEYEADADNLTAFATDADYCNLGENHEPKGALAHPIYVDDLKVWTTYDQQ